MRKRLLAMALVLATLLMTACGGSGKSYTPGTFTSNGYETEFLGFRFTTPDGFVLSDEEELSQMMGMALDLMGDDVTEVQKKYAELTTIYELVVADSLGAANANITLEKTSVSVDKYIELFKEQVTSMTAMSVSLNDTEEKVTLAGAEYTKLSASVASSGMVLNQEYYMRKVGDRMMCLTLTWVDGYEDEKEAILNGFAAY